MRCRGHQKVNTEQEIGNNLADNEARWVAEETEIEIAALIWNSKPETLDLKLEHIKYSRDDNHLIENLKGKKQKDGCAYIPDGHLVIPSNILGKLVLEEHNKTHWGAGALYKYLNKKMVGHNLYTGINQVIQQCEIC